MEHVKQAHSWSTLPYSLSSCPKPNDFFDRHYEAINELYWEQTKVNGKTVQIVADIKEDLGRFAFSETVRQMEKRWLRSRIVK